MKDEVLNPEAMADDEPLLPHETPWEEFVRIFPEGSDGHRRLHRITVSLGSGHWGKGSNRMGRRL